MSANELKEFLSTVSLADADVLLKMAGDVDPICLGLIPKTCKVHFEMVQGNSMRIWSSTTSCYAIDHAKHLSAVVVRAGAEYYSAARARTQTGRSSHASSKAFRATRTPDTSNGSSSNGSAERGHRKRVCLGKERDLGVNRFIKYADSATALDCVAG